MRMIRKVVLTVLGATLCLLAIDALATTENSKTIDRLGVQGNNAYISTVEPLSVACQWSNIYFDITTSFGKAAYADVILAKSSGRKLSRIDYSLASDGVTCVLSLVEVEN